MGQSSSTTGTSPDVNLCELATSRRFSFLSPVGISSEEPNDEVEGYDCTSDLPDECLASVFRFLGPGDRKRCSLVCRRWLQVDGQSRNRLSLSAQAEVFPFLPSLFGRFDSVTKLSLRCDRKSISINDDAFVLISLHCRNITRLKLRGCREITAVGMEAFAKNCKDLKKLSCGSCMFGAVTISAVLNHCPNLEELSVKRLRGLHDGTEAIEPAAAASSLKSISLKELVNGQRFTPLITASQNLKTLRLIRCLGDWDKLFEKLTNENRNSSLIEIHLERLQVSDLGLLAISKCSKLETLHIVKTPECSNDGLISIAEHCKRLRKLHIDGWRTNRINDDGLIALAQKSINLQELVLIGINPTSLSLAEIASNCLKLERLALCGSGSIGDAEIACIAAKCMSLKKLCIKGCPISNIGVEALAWGCPNLVKIKVKKCIGVTGEVAEWLKERRESLIVNWDSGQTESDHLDATITNMTIANQETSTEVVAIGNGRLTMLRTKMGLLAGRSFVASQFRRWSSGDSSGNVF